MKPNLHRLLLNEDETFRSRTSSFGLGFPSLSTQHHLPPPPNSPERAPINPTSTIDSSFALTILILLTALFFIGFFSVYARRLSEETTAEISRRRREQLQQQRGFARNPSPSHGLDPDAVRTLPCLAYGVCAKEPHDCAVCLSEFDEKETVKIIPRCGHLYHPQCIDSWLRSRGSCPLCRSTRLFPEEEEEVRLEVLDEMRGGVSEEDGAREGRMSCEGGRLVALRRTRSWCRRTERMRAVLGRSYSF